jgi:hypothetical protein
MPFPYGNAAPNARANRSGRSNTEVLALNLIKELCSAPVRTIETNLFVN